MASILTGAVPALHGAQARLAPFASVNHILSGEMNAQRWAQVGVVLVRVVALIAADNLRELPTAQAALRFVSEGRVMVGICQASVRQTRQK